MADPTDPSAQEPSATQSSATEPSATEPSAAERLAANQSAAESSVSNSARDLARSLQHRRRKRVLWLLPILLLLSSVFAVWGVRHIEQQVVAAAPGILQLAGVDSSGLRFDADYRNIVVAGQLPKGVSAEQVRTILEQKRGLTGEDIRRATVVAVEWTEPESASGLSEPLGDAEEIAVQAGVDPDTGSNLGTLPRVTVLLRDNEMILRGTEVTNPQIQRLDEAASAAIGPSNVKQQWQAVAGRDNSGDVKNADADGASIAPLATLVSLLGDHATAASITYEDSAISGSIEAISERSANLIKMQAGNGVVVTSTVAIAKQAEDQSISGDNAIDSLTDADDVAADAADETTNQTTDEATNEAQMGAEISALQKEIDALQQQINDNVFFVHDSSLITREAQPLLDKVGDAIRRYRRPGVMIAGHTDSLAGAEYNMKLSQQRAAAVKQFLVQNGVDSKRLRHEGYGEEKPVASNRTRLERRLNRRVEFTARKPFAAGE